MKLFVIFDKVSKTTGFVWEQPTLDAGKRAFEDFKAKQNHPEDFDCYYVGQKDGLQLQAIVSIPIDEAIMETLEIQEEIK